MARIMIEFDTQQESISDVLRQLHFEVTRQGTRAPAPSDTEQVDDVPPLPADSDDAPPPPNDLKEFTDNGEDDDSAAPPPPPPAAELDSAGIPHDLRIHTKTKGKKADGTWKRRKGIDDATYNSVMEELKAQAPAPPVDATGDGSAPPPPPADNEMSWPDVNAKLIAYVQGGGKEAQENLNAKLKEAGIENYALLSRRDDLWADLLGKLGLS